MNPLDLLLSLSLFLIMAGIGLSIKPKELLATLKSPKKLFFGAFLQILIFPVIAFFLIKGADIDPIWKAGIVILAACPGGPLSNLLTSMLKGNLPLSVEMTTLNSFISLITLPIYSTFAIQYFLKDTVIMSLPILDLVLTLLLITTVPIFIGTIIKHKKSKFAKDFQSKVKFSGTVLFVSVLAIKILFSSDGSPMQLSIILDLLPWVVALNIIGMLFGYFIPRLFGFNKRADITYAAEIGIQNTVLALLVTETLLHSPGMGEPALIYAIISFGLDLALGYFIEKEL